MKHFLGVLCLLTCGCLLARADALDVWSWRNPLPQGDNLNAVAFGNGRYVAVGGNNVVVATNLFAWQAQVVTNQSLLGIAYGGGKFVAVGTDQDLTAGSILISGDNGGHWKSAGKPDNYLAAVTYGDGRFVAVGAGGLTMTSGDGDQWSTDSAGENYWLTGVAWGQGKFVAVDYNGRVLTSANGRDWSLAATLGFGQLSAVAYGNGVFVVVNNNSGWAAVSTNAVDWQPVNTVNSSGYFAISHGAAGFVAVGQSGVVQISPDGWQWTAQSLDGYNLMLKGVVQDGNRVAVVGERGTILVSTNVTNWLEVGQGLRDDFMAIAFGAGRFVVPGYSAAVVLSSTDGVQWEEFPLSHAGQFRSAVWGDGLFAAVGEVGSICTSPDGTNWTYQSAGTVQNLYAITFGAGRFVAVGEAGTILSSTDGSGWDASPVSTNLNLNGVTYGAGMFVATGDNGAVLLSSNGTDWAIAPTLIQGSLGTVVYGARRFMVLTDAGTILASTDAVNWQTVSNVTLAESLFFGGTYFLAGSSQQGLWTSSDALAWQIRSVLQGKAINNFAFGAGTFVAVGDGGLILQSGPVPPPVNVTVQSEVEPPSAACGFSVDGLFYDTPQMFEWAAGSSHALAAEPVIFNGLDVCFAWAGWSDGGSASHSVTPATATNYTAKFNLLYHLTMKATPGGSITPPDYWHIPGTQITINATPKPGCAFLGWVGEGTNAFSGTNRSAAITLHQPVAETAIFNDPVLPTVSITSPKPGKVWTPLEFVVSGKAKDNDAVTNVYVQINGGPWLPATTTNAWHNWTWTGGGLLIEGDNTVLAYAVDASGNQSLTDELMIKYKFVPALELIIAGQGKVNGAYNGQQFTIGRKVTVKAKPDEGYDLAHWQMRVDGVTNQFTERTLSFLMASNVSLTATFVDVARPKLSFTTPKAGQQVTNSVFNMTGTVTDNGAGSNVWYRVNNGAWSKAGGWALWSARVTLQPGENILNAYAVDAAGNLSSTNQRSVTLTVPAP